MSIYVWKKSRSYTKIQVNLMINISTRLLLNQKGYQHLKDSMKTVLWHVTNISLRKSLMIENHSVNFQTHWMSNIRMLFVCYVQLRQSARPPGQAIFTVKRCKVPWPLKNKPKVQKIIFQFNYTSSSGCAISNWKWLYLRLYWWQLRKIN